MFTEIADLGFLKVKIRLYPNLETLFWDCFEVVDLSIAARRSRRLHTCLGLNEVADLSIAARRPRRL